MTQTVSGFTVPAGSDPVSSIDDTLVTFAGEVRAAITAATELPTQTGNSGKFLKSDGSAASWDLPIPSQSGQSGKYLTTDGSVASWGTVVAGSVTVLASGSLSGTGLSLTSISGSYKKLILVIRNFQASAIISPVVTVNGLTTGYYENCYAWGFGSTSGTYMGQNLASFGCCYEYPVTGDNKNTLIIEFPDYADTTSYKKIVANSSVLGTSSNRSVTFSNGAAKTTSAITSILLSTSNGTATMAGTYELQGVK